MRPYHDIADVNGGGPHGEANAIADVNGGQMDGFILQRDAASRHLHATPTTRPARLRRTPDVMGYHTAAEIPNYWTYAKDFVLDDHMFEPVQVVVAARSPVHGVGLVGQVREPLADELRQQHRRARTGSQFDQAVDQELATGKTDIDLAWTDITWLLYAQHVSWRYYVQTGYQPDCDERLGRDLHAGPAERHDARASGTRCRCSATCSRTISWATSRRSTDYFPRPRPGTLPAVTLDRPLPGRQRAPAGQRAPGPGLRHRDHQRRHEEPGLEVHRDLLVLGRLGRLLRPRRAARRSTRTATACASRPWSSRPTPGAATSTTRRSAATPT